LLVGGTARGVPILSAIGHTGATIVVLDVTVNWSNQNKFSIVVAYTGLSRHAAARKRRRGISVDSTVLTNLEPIMKLAPFARFAPFAALLISAAVAVPAFAGEDTAAANNAPKTRAEVRAELAQARADGELSMNPNAPAYPAQFATGGYTVPRVQINTVRTSAERDASLNRAAVQN